MEFVDDLDLGLAWRKTKRDFNHHMNSFVKPPHIIDILDSKKDIWFDNIRYELTEETFSPQTSRHVDVPKSNYHLRPGAVLDPVDVTVYSAFTLHIFDEIKNTISWSEHTCRYSHILPDDITDDNRWVDFEKTNWQDMKRKKFDLAEEYDYVLETDVSGYYENIDLRRMMSVIKQILDTDEKQSVAYAIRDLLDPWADPRRRGIPQGYGPSNILAELYLDSIDRRLVNNGFKHIRYNDDYTVFCNTQDDAIQAQNMLERLFRNRGLNIKSGKTTIMSSEEAIESYSEIESSFKDLKHELGYLSDEEMTEEAIVVDTPYGTREMKVEVPDEEPTVEEPQELPEEVLEKGFSEHIEGKDPNDVQIHFFRFIINRLGNHDNELAVEYCIEYIKEGCPEVRRILYDYFQDLSNKTVIADRLAQAITDEEIRYNYHEYVLLRWFFEEGFNSSTILHCARQILSSRNYMIEARDYAVSILGEFGDYSDLESLELMYNRDLMTQSKAVFVYSVRDFESDHRGLFYDRIDDSDDIIEYSIDAAKRDS